jgi:hypothetical protein
MAACLGAQIHAHVGAPRHTGTLALPRLAVGGIITSFLARLRRSLYLIELHLLSTADL